MLAVCLSGPLGHPSLSSLCSMFRRDSFVHLTSSGPGSALADDTALDILTHTQAFRQGSGLNRGCRSTCVHFLIGVLQYCPPPRGFFFNLSVGSLQWWAGGSFNHCPECLPRAQLSSPQEPLLPVPCGQAGVTQEAEAWHGSCGALAILEPHGAKGSPMGATVTCQHRARWSLSSQYSMLLIPAVVHGLPGDAAPDIRPPLRQGH